MTGNDIVDLAAAADESNWKRKGFLEKLFTAEEQLYITAAASPELIIWRMWTMKESAYKILTRQNGGRFFAPNKFKCRVLSAVNGQVIYNDTVYQTQTQTTNQYIYSIAGADKSDLNPVLNACFKIPNLAHALLKKFVYQRIISDFASQQKKNKFTVIKDKNNLPFLCCEGSRHFIPISITHHGRYAAFTIN